MNHDASDRERRLTIAQCEHLRRLYLAFEQAQRELNDFATYLLSEHGIQDPAQWQLSADMARLVRLDAAGDPGQACQPPGTG